MLDPLRGNRVEHAIDLDVVPQGHIGKVILVVVQVPGKDGVDIGSDLDLVVQIPLLHLRPVIEVEALASRIETHDRLLGHERYSSIETEPGSP